MLRSTFIGLSRFPVAGKKHALRAVPSQIVNSRLLFPSMNVIHHSDVKLSNHQTTWPIIHKVSLARLFSNDSQTPNGSTGSKSSQNKPDNQGNPEKEGTGSNGTTGEEQASENDEEPKESKEEALQKELEESRDQLLRALADVENTRQRLLKEVENARHYAIQSFAKQLLDVADNLQRALDSVPQEAVKLPAADKHVVSLFEGVHMTRTELQKVLRANNVVEFGAVGDDFDPHMHDAMFQMQDPSKKPNTIAQVLKTGYKIKDRVLRPAQVATIQGSK